MMTWEQEMKDLLLRGYTVMYEGLFGYGVMTLEDLEDTIWECDWSLDSIDEEKKIAYWSEDIPDEWDD